MRHDCKYCYKITTFDLAEGEYWECQECGGRPFRRGMARIHNPPTKKQKEILDAYNKVCRGG